MQHAGEKACLECRKHFQCCVALGIVVGTCKPSTTEAESDDQEFKVTLLIHSEFKANLGYVNEALSQPGD